MHATLRALVAGSASLALLGPAGPGFSVPHVSRGSLSCFAEVPGVTARGVPTTFRYEDGKGSSETRGPDDLGYQPRDIAYPHPVSDGNATRTTPGGVAGARAATVTSYWFTLVGSELREVTEVDRRNPRGVFLAASYATRVVRKHWDGVRQISLGRAREHLYVLTNTDQLLQYRLSGKNGNTTVRFAGTVGIGFGAIGTFEYERTVSDDGVRSDVFLATDADSGELLEFTIPVDDPSAYTRVVLATDGWTDQRSVGRTASCINPKSGRSYAGIVTVDLEGEVRLWTDRDARDGDGSDITRRGVLNDSWQPMPYSD